jgi:hypothetical protein
MLVATSKKYDITKDKMSNTNNPKSLDSNAARKRLSKYVYLPEDIIWDELNMKLLDAIGQQVSYTTDTNIRENIQHKVGNATWASVFYSAVFIKNRFNRNF